MEESGVERGGGMLFCVMGHTFCHPSGTFQLYVATNFSVVGWWHVCPCRAAIHIHCCAQRHFPHGRYHRSSESSGFSALPQSPRPKLLLIWTSLALSPDAIQTLPVAFKVSPLSHTTRCVPGLLSAVIFLRGWWHSWIRSPVISPLEWERQCRPDHLWKYSKAVVNAEECVSDRWYLWRGGLWLLAPKHKQSVSRKGTVILMQCL